MTGAPFKYFSYGVACAEVEVDGFSGTPTLRRVDIVQDVGDSLSPLIDLGQIEGGFLQGVGWMTQEQLLWDTSDGPGPVSYTHLDVYKRQGQPWTMAVARRAGDVLRTEGTPITDTRASADYRRAMLGEALPRFFAELGDPRGSSEVVEVAS